MPVESFEVGEAPATIRFEQPEGPFVVGVVDVDAVGKSTGFHEANPGDERVGTDMHDQTPSGQFEQPGPQVVQLEGFERPSDDDEKPSPKPKPRADDEPSVQTKVVTAPEGETPASTPGAETK